MEKAKKLSKDKVTPTTAKAEGKSLGLLNLAKVVMIIAFIIFLFKIPGYFENYLDKKKQIYKPTLVTQTISPGKEHWIPFGEVKGTRRIFFSTPDNEVELTVRSEAGLRGEPFKEKIYIFSPTDKGLYATVSKEIELTITLEH